MSENVKKIRELADFNVNTEISRDDLLIVATGPDTRRDSEGNADPISPQTVKATIEAIITAYNKSLIPPSGGSTTTPSDRPNAEVPKPGGGTYLQDTTPFTAANLELMAGSGCGLTVVEECHNESQVSVGCSDVNMKYKTKKLCLGNIPASALSLDANDDLELVDGNLKVKEDVSGTPELAPGGGLTLDEDGNLMLETDPEQFGFIAYLNITSPAGTTLDGEGNIQTIDGKRVVQDRFSSWNTFYNYASKVITSNKGTIYLIMESDSTMAGTSARAFIIPGTWPTIKVYGNKVMGEWVAGIGDKPLTLADFNGQRKLKMVCDMSTNVSQNIAVGVAYKGATINFNFVHFKITKSTVPGTSMFSVFRSAGRLDLGCCKIEITSNTGASLGNVLESIGGGRIELMTPAVVGKCNTADFSDPFFLGGGKNHPALEIKNVVAGSFFKAWDANSAIKMVEYQFHTWPNHQEYFTGDARVHFEGSNNFNHFMYISQGSSFNSNGPVISIGMSGGDSITISGKTFYTRLYNPLTFGKWSDGTTTDNVPIIPGAAKFDSPNEFIYQPPGNDPQGQPYPAVTLSNDYAIDGDFTNGTAVSRSNYV